MQFRSAASKLINPFLIPENNVPITIFKEYQRKYHHISWTPLEFLLYICSFFVGFEQLCGRFFPDVSSLEND